MFKKVSLFILAVILTTSLSQAQSEFTYKRGNVLQDGIRLTPTKVRAVMSENNEALKTFNSGQTFGTVGNVFGGIGGGLVGWDLQSRIRGEGNGTLLAVGAVSIGVGLGFALIGDAKVKKSVTLYNSKLSEKSVSYQINLGFTQTGFGFSVRF